MTDWPMTLFHDPRCPMWSFLFPECSASQWQRNKTPSQCQADDSCTGIREKFINIFSECDQWDWPWDASTTTHPTLVTTTSSSLDSSNRTSPKTACTVTALTKQRSTLRISPKLILQETMTEVSDRSGHRKQINVLVCLALYFRLLLFLPLIY